MKSIVFPFIIILAVLLGSHSLARWYHLVQYKNFGAEQLSTFQSDVASLKGLRAFYNSSLGTHEMGVALYRKLFKVAQLEQLPDRRIALLCESLSVLGSLLQGRPFDSQLLIRWADIRQMLGTNINCQESNTQGQYDAVLDLALKSDPTNVDVQYSAGLLNLWSGHKQKALSLFSSYLKSAINFSSGQMQTIIGAIESPEDLKLLVPARFPQIVNFSAIFAKQRQDLFLASSAVLADLQTAAIEESAASLRISAITPEIHTKRLLSLLGLGVETKVRQFADLELAHVSRINGDNKLADYLDWRSGLTELLINRAFIRADSRPAKTPLVAWNSIGVVELDSFYNSIGFFTSDQQHPVMVEIVSESGSNQAVLPSLRLYASKDNDKWYEIVMDEKPLSFIVAEESIVVIKLPKEDAHYWKLNYSSAARDRKFTNELDRLVRVYGK